MLRFYCFLEVIVMNSFEMVLMSFLVWFYIFLKELRFYLGGFEIELICVFIVV